MKSRSRQNKSGDRSQTRGCVWGKVSIGQGHKGAFWGAGSATCLIWVLLTCCKYLQKFIKLAPKACEVCECVCVCTYMYAHTHTLVCVLNIHYIGTFPHISSCTPKMCECVTSFSNTLRFLGLHPRPIAFSLRKHPEICPRNYNQEISKTTDFTACQQSPL